MKTKIQKVPLVKKINRHPIFKINGSKKKEILQKSNPSIDINGNLKRGRYTLGRKIAMAAGVCIILTVGMVSVASAKGQLGNVIGRFNGASGAGILTSIQFQGSQGNPYGSEKAEAFQSVKSISQLHSLIPSFPKLSLPGWTISPLLTGVQKYNHTDAYVSISANSPDVTINAYHDLTKTMIIDGMSVTSPRVQTIVLDGVEAKIFSFNAKGTGGISYVVWKRDGWTLALSSFDKNSIFNIAETFDRKFRQGMVHGE